MTTKLIVPLLMSTILVSGLSGCVTKYRSSQVNLEPAYISKQTIHWCVESKCPNYVKTDLTSCQLNAVKQTKRNNLDDSIVKEDIGDKIVGGFMTVTGWIF